jgi:hypothetical protein
MGTDAEEAQRLHSFAQRRWQAEKWMTSFPRHRVAAVLAAVEEPDLRGGAIWIEGPVVEISAVKTILSVAL